ncbi:hypothetical protein OIO90_004755 [Microbotryomycetes sp. JL221]|nr:hypothetical protein OIO90_004755 [Microbotryomycetes sp. JL221]
MVPTLASTGLILALLLICTNGQLLFPANEVTQLTFGPTTTLVNTSLRGVPWSELRAPRIAIIGAGAGGTSAAYFLSLLNQTQNNFDLKTKVTLFEKQTYVGGRSFPIKPWLDDPIHYNHNDDDDDEPVECGASIFVEANKNINKAVRLFNLTLKQHSNEQGVMAIWNGQQFVFQESNSRGWGYWDIAKMLWRYGRAPLRIKNLVTKTVKDFTSVYSSEFASKGPFDSIQDFAESINLLEPCSMVANDYFDKYTTSSSQLFVNEIVGAATAVNYAQSVHNIHAVGALVSMAANGASAVKGGNRRVFENFLSKSQAHVKLGETVKSITKLDAAQGKRPQFVVKTSGNGGGTFDAVIFAAPFHQTGIELVGFKQSVQNRIPHQEYIQLHVTFVITNATTPLPEYFGLKQGTTVPKTIFTTYDTQTSRQQNKPEFNSLNYLQTLSDQTKEKFFNNVTGTLHVVKMFSMHPIMNNEKGQILLNNLFGPSNLIKVWSTSFLSYPKLDPVQMNSKTNGDQNLQQWKSNFSSIRPDESVYYVNSFERLISTMETETVSSWNIVSLLLQDFFAFKPNSSWVEG